MGKKVFKPENMHKLESPERYKELPPGEILDLMGLTAGQEVVDLGCGLGYFAIPAAGLVGENGHVYGLDISPEMLSAMEDRTPEDLKGRLTGMLIGPEGPINEGQILVGRDLGETHSSNPVVLQAGSLDHVLIATVLHEVPHAKKTLEEALALLKPGGKLAVIEWIKKEMPHGPRQSIRIAREDLDHLAGQVGMTHVLYKDLSMRFYISIYKK